MVDYKPTKADREDEFHIFTIRIWHNEKPESKTMKVLLFAILERGRETDALYSAIIADGYNGTMIKTQSLKHVLQNEDLEKAAALSLSEIAEDTHEPGQNSTMFIIVEEAKLARLQKDIREHTGNFKKIHGAMFVVPITSFEGSF